MGKSIIFKTSFAIIIIQITLLSVIGWHIHSSQTDIVNDLLKKQKEYISTQLDRTEKMAIEKEKEILNSLVLSIMGAVSESLYNMDNDSVKITLEKFAKYENIKAVYLYDFASGYPFSMGYKENGNFIFSEELPQRFHNLNYIKKNLSAYGETVGYIKVYFDNEKTINDIALLKKSDLKKLDDQIEYTNQRIEEEVFHQFVIFILGSLFTIVAIVLLLIKFVNRPLRLFKTGLDSFFDYLSDPRKSVQEITIKGDDEFGQMSKSVNESIQISIKMHGEIANLMNTMDKNVITSETDEKGNITFVSEAFCKISGYSKDELIGKSHSIIRHPDMKKEIFEDLWKTIKDGNIWEGEIKNRKKDGGFYWVRTVVSPKCTKAGADCGYTAIRYDITAHKEVEELKSNLEIKIEERTKELATQKENVEQILANILLPVFITSKERRTLVYANQFAQNLYEIESGKETPLDNIYSLSGGRERIIEELIKNGKVDALEDEVITHTGKKFTALLSVIPIYYNGEECFIGMTVDITKQKDMEKEIRRVHEHTKDSIEYASLIQSSVLPDLKVFSNYFQDHFVIWEPKDTVGGDIYLFDELRHEDECLLCFIDCTGHGVPGAFVTMLVKAVEARILAEIKANPMMEVSPAWVMAYFNRALKTLLKQHNEEGVSNAGFDGGIIYYNKQEKILKFAGSETPLFYVTNDGEFKTVKGDRYSVGYKKCDINYQYKETVIEIEEGMKFYCTTDGYIDQNGGEKDFPFGKKRFRKIIEDSHTMPMSKQRDILLEKMNHYENMVPDNERNDDMTVIGFTI